MSTVFIGGSRHVSRLPAEVKQRLNNVIGKQLRVIVGDANGADKAVQKHFSEAAYDSVTVFCSGESYRNNLGQWPTRKVDAAKNLKGFQFYAVKDREMAREADIGLMIWDGKSPGTVLNVLRLVRAGKIAVLYNVPDKRAIDLKTSADLEAFLSRCSSELLRELRERATPEEWPQGAALANSASDQPKDRQESKPATVPQADLFDQDLAATLNTALATADPTTIVEALGNIAKSRGMSQVARETGLAREALYRALSPSGNPEFATVLKVVSSLGLRLTVSPTWQGTTATRLEV